MKKEEMKNRFGWGKSKSKNKNQNNGGVLVRPVGFPKMYVSQPILTQRFRFTSSAATLTSVTVGALCRLLCMNVSANLMYPILLGVRLLKIKLYGSPSASLSSNVLNWTSTQGPYRELSDSGSGNSPAYISSSPPKDSLASFWNNSNTTQATGLFQISTVAGSFVDIDVQYTVLDIAAPAFAGISTTAGGTIGTVYTSALDNWTTGGVWNGSPLYTPVNKITIV